MPTCRVCSQELALGDFYKNQLRKAGDVGECKECTKARVRRRAQSDPKVREYDRKRAKTPKRKEHIRQTVKKWREENPIGYKAHSAVSNAVRDGRLTKQPCYFCGKENVHAHHKDYEKPLDVIWLCPKCHHRLHAAFPETEASGKGAV